MRGLLVDTPGVWAAILSAWCLRLLLHITCWMHSVTPYVTSSVKFVSSLHPGCRNPLCDVVRRLQASLGWLSNIRLCVIPYLSCRLV